MNIAVECHSALSTGPLSSPVNSTPHTNTRYPHDSSSKKRTTLKSTLKNTMLGIGSYKYFNILVGFVSTSVLLPSIRTPIIRCDTSHDSKKEKEEDSYVEQSYKFVSELLQWTGTNGDQQTLERSEQNKDLAISELQLREKYEAPKYPVVLCHGLSGFDKLMVLPSFSYLVGLSKHKDTARRDFVVTDHNGVALEYWFGIKEALEEKGTTVMVAKVPGFGSIKDRATHLNKFITREVEMLRQKSVDDIYNDDNQSVKSFEEKDKKMKINLIAHSMGGLDARYLISELEKKNYEVVSLSTVTTPHRGSEVADYIVAMAKQMPLGNVNLPPCMYQLTTEYMSKFNEKIKDDPKVSYFSYGAAFHPSWYSVFHYSWSIINSRCGDNDGMVSVNSAKWGTYLGTLQNVDHLDLINWTNGFKRMANMVVPSSVKPPPINSVALYLDIADNLAKRGL